ncbi:hypothetical protein [Sulfobacillus thermosulfidooxidans]|uniref:hypothetical protein n=1 Tax=Sulfobacillus thermosulfidooxidans TaxID=28034 RepID=UPI0006B5C38F|nr:hypothetical protein [Sulfobacillus thermosulfidooxidans]
MSELGSHMTPAKLPEDLPPRKKKLWHIERPHWYWPWWVILSLIVATLMAISYFMGMIATLSSAHTLLTNLHQQLNAIASEKAHLNKEAQLLGVLQNLKTGHWSSPLAWAILAPQGLWLLSGLILGIGMTVLFYRQRIKLSRPIVRPASPLETAEFTSAYRPEPPQPKPFVSEPLPHPSWLREFIGLVLWVVIVAGLAFLIVHTGMMWHHLPSHLSNLSRWL